MDGSVTTWHSVAVVYIIIQFSIVVYTFCYICMVGLKAQRAMEFVEIFALPRFFGN